MSLLLAALLLAAAAEPGLPADGFRGWERASASERFRGAELYGHINGGSEVYLEAGFEDLLVQRYQRGAAEIELELYRMKDPLAALAIYLERCGRETPASSLTYRHTLGRFQLLLVRGPVLLVVNNPTGAPALAEEMVGFAAAVAASLPEQAAIVPDLLPEKGLLEGSLRLIRGPVALGALVTLGEGDVLQLGEQVLAAAARYRDAGGEHVRVAADYPDEAVAVAALAYLATHLDATLTPVERSATRLVFRDHAGRWGEARAQGRRLEIRCGLTAAPEAD